mmetsp:Transcript_36310/g.67065  ORF Transcript_36310/g.67065 Transcript_36310/m.67065 type:complete len:197 (-) Transcript_36310:349-939(-)|eukprot:CAMPEP_0197466132 /NCGR_PEP_ID=MMETSP1175-20131217/64892_1 /TAXON_ID=1003142 /ORGANISM="Triceratium dubium, Strain CCMP147" /LENGTH=196 /DNA_ID=CAMNT_0043002161 /DNA_START=142 /DNA_END=732 /DNA_ORIENTATION=+
MLRLLVALLSISAAVSVPQPVTELNVDAYLGRWYQTYASLTVKWTFELGGNCVTADYGPTETADVVSVVNTVRPRFLRRREGNDGIKIDGFAKQSPETAGALSVALGPGAGADPYQTNFNDYDGYWIVKLGPMVEGKYDWAMVSDADQSTLYVLVRNVQRFRNDYEEEVLNEAKNMGFTRFFNKPRITPQENCRYE